MRRALLIWCLLLAGIVCISQSERTSAFWQSRDSNYNISISTGGALACSYTPITSATYNVAYTGATPSASGGTPSYTFSQTGTLPPGFSISSSTGVISGTDSVDSGGATYPGIQVTVTDSLSNTANCGSSFTITVSAAYAGPGDCCSITTWKAWWGFRCFSAAYSGNVADIQNAGATLGTRLQCSGGAITADGSATDCTFITGNVCSALLTTCAVACYLEELYDQSGKTNCSSAACNLVQATQAKQPKINNSFNGSATCATYLAANDTGIDNSGSFTQAQTLSVSFVANHTSAATTGIVIGADTNLNTEFGFATSAKLYFYAGTASNTVAETDGTTYAVNGLVSGSSSAIMINGALTSGLVMGSSGYSSEHLNLGHVIGVNYFTGTICEAGIASGDQSGNFSALNTNQRAAYGVF
jgi:hypothetical protein